jgi:hypothetical protein
LESRRLLSISLQPLSNQVLPQGSAAQTVDLSQIFFDNLTGTTDLAFSVRSDNTALAQATLNSSVMTLALAPTGSGFAHIAILASAPDGSTASQTLRVQVTAAPDRTLTVPIGTPGHGTFRFVQANQTIGQISLIGPGSGTITLGGDNLSLVGDHTRGANQELENINLTGTTAATQLVITGVEAKGGRLLADIGNIASDGSIGTIRIQKVDLVGDVTLQGGVSSINIADAQSSTLSFGQSIGAIGLKVGFFADVNLSTPAPFGLIQGGNWVSTDSVAESLQAAYINRIFTNSNFDVGVQLTGTGAPARTIGKVTILGAIGGTWNVPGSCAPLLIGGTTSDWNATFHSLSGINDLGSMGGSLSVPSLNYLRVHGSMLGALVNLTGTSGTDLGEMHVYNLIRGSAIESAANLGPIIAEAMQNSIIYAGVAPLASGQALPATAADLSSAATIASVSLRPRGKVKIGFQGSDIAAANIGTLGLSTTEVANNGVAFGVAGESIGRLTVRDLTNRRTLAFNNVHDAAALAAQIAAQKLNLEDFNITVLS